MESKLARESRQFMIESCKRMTPEARLEACVELSRTHAELYVRGKTARDERTKKLNENN